MSSANQPISRVLWLPRSMLSANDWNPNKQAPPEHRLLKTSILENGWTQPIVARVVGEPAVLVESLRLELEAERADLANRIAAIDQALQPVGSGGLEIVDGYHRWTVSADPAVLDLGEGTVPVVQLPNTDPALARMATIRHNRARGTHRVLGMADIVADLLDLGMTAPEIGKRLEMDDEEVDRLSDRGQMTKRGSNPEGAFGNGWTV